MLICYEQITAFQGMGGYVLVELLIVLFRKVLKEGRWREYRGSDAHGLEEIAVDSANFQFSFVERNFWLLDGVIVERSEFSQDIFHLM